MGVEAAPPAQGSTHTPISAGETAERVPGTLRPDAEPPVGEPWEAALNSATWLRADAAAPTKAPLARYRRAQSPTMTTYKPVPARVPLHLGVSHARLIQ